MRRPWQTRAPAGRLGLCLGIVGALGGLGCGGSAMLADVTLTATGSAPKVAAVRRHGTVVFINNDLVLHQIVSDPRGGCHELDGPVLTQGQSFTALMSDVDETCRYLDLLDPTDVRFHGVVQVGNGGTGTSSISSMGM